MEKTKWLAAGIATVLVIGGLAVTALAQTPIATTTPTAGAAVNPPAQNSPTAGHKTPRWEAGIRDRALAEAILKASGKTREELKALKQGKTWQEVATALGLDWTQIQKDAKSLAQAKAQGHARQGGIVSFLAELTGKSPKDILALKTPSNTWVDVAKQLGVTVNR